MKDNVHTQVWKTQVRFKKKKSEKQLKGEKDTLSSEKQQTESWPLSSDGS